MKKILQACRLSPWLIFAVLHPAYAAHPLVTDDTGVQGEGHHQLEINTDWSRQAGDSGHIGTFTYTYGLTGNLDLFADVPHTFRSAADSGAGDASLGAKWRFVDEDGLSLALKPEWFLPTGDADKSLGNGKSSVALTAIASYETGAWTLHGNLGANFNRYRLPGDDESKRKLVWRTSAAVWYAVHPQWKLVADMGVAQNQDKANRTYPAYGLVGAIWSPNDTVDLDIGAKFGLNKAEVTRQLGLGVTFHF